MIEWLDGVWAGTRSVHLVEGGEDGGPVCARVVLAELSDAVSVGRLRLLTTTGRFTGDICRCHGGLMIVLRDAAGRILASGSVHGHGRVSWERARFRNDLIVADPTALHLLLARCGIAGQLTAFLAPLAGLLDLNEVDGRPQFRPAGEEGERCLREHGVPDVLHPALRVVTGEQAGALSREAVDDLRRRLTDATPAPVDRAAVLLSWLGHLTIPVEALWGEGVLVRKLLTHLTADDIASAATGIRTGHTAMGIVNLTMHQGDDGTLPTPSAPPCTTCSQQPRQMPPATVGQRSDTPRAEMAHASRQNSNVILEVSPSS
jgi:hypothetical protein